MSATLHARNVHIRFEGAKTKALDAVNATCKPGQITALLGPNGSGKSTLLLALAGLLKPTKGQVQIGAQNIVALTATERAARIACLFQNESVAFDFTAEEIVNLGAPVGSTPDITAAILQRLELSHLATRRWSQLSGGERQRTQLARVLVANADFLLLDEPFNHLDLRTRALLLQIIAEEAGRGAAVIFSCHDLESASHAHRAIVLNHGHLVAAGAPSEVVTQELAAQVFSVHVTPLADPGDRAPYLRLTAPLSHSSPKSL